MDSISAQIFLGYNPDYDPALRDPANPSSIEYARKAISNIRMQWKSYIMDRGVFIENKDYLFSRQSLDKVIAQFKDEEFKKCTEWRNMGLFEAIRNTLMEEITKDPPKAELRSIDPSAVALRKKDLGLLKNRGIIQADITAIQKQIYPPNAPIANFKVSSDNYQSNIDEFDEMGLDENDPDDMMFFKDYHVLDCDIAGQALLNNVMSLNRFDQETLRKFVIDILAARKISFQQYVDKITGQIKYHYIYPDTAWGIFGDSFDGHDDQAQGWQDNITIGTWLQMVGNDFDFEKDWRKLLAAINYNSIQKYTGFNRGGTIYNCFGNIQALQEIGLTHGASDFVMGWEDAFRFRVSAGYVEWKTWEATSTNLYRKDTDEVVNIVPYSYGIDGKEEITGYDKKSKFQEQMYGCYFLATGPQTQMLFNYSKVYYQQLEGANDEYASGTIVFYREPGDPAVSMVKTDIEFVHIVFYKMLFLVYKAKPEDEEYVFEELIEMAKIYKQAFPEAKDAGTAGFEGIIQNIITYMRANTVKIRTFPKVNGTTIPQIPQLGGHKGIDPLAPIFNTLVEWGEARLSKKILGNGMRLGMNPPSRESNKSEQNTVDASQNSTNYIYRFIQYLKERVATTTTLYAQDIIKFKDSIPYNFLVNLLGNERFNSLKLLDEFALHRYGKFFKDYNSEVAKAELKQAAAIALTQKEITYVQYVIVTQTEDFREGAKKLALMQYKAAKKLRNQQVQDIQMQGQIAQQQHVNDMELEQLKGKNLLAGKNVDANALVTGKQIDAKSKEDIKDKTIASEPDKIAYQTQGKQDLEYTKANLEESKPFGT